MNGTGNGNAPKTESMGLARIVVFSLAAVAMTGLIGIFTILVLLSKSLGSDGATLVIASLSGIQTMLAGAVGAIGAILARPSQTPPATAGDSPSNPASVVVTNPVSDPVPVDSTEKPEGNNP